MKNSAIYSSASTFGEKSFPKDKHFLNDDISSFPPAFHVTELKEMII